MQDDDEEVDVEDTIQRRNKEAVEMKQTMRMKTIWKYKILNNLKEITVQEAEYSVRRDKKVREKLIRKMKGYYAAIYEHDSKEVFKDLRKVKSKVRQE